MLAGNSVARNVYERGLIPAFKVAYAKRHPGRSVDFVQSYDGSGAQTRAILSGLKANVAALSLSSEIDKLVRAGLVSKDWKKGENAGVPATSVVVMIVRKGNPKNIRDWGDLTRQDVDVVLPNPDTSGAAQWNVAAMYGGAMFDSLNSSNTRGAGPVMDDFMMSAFLARVKARVKAYGKSGKEAMQIFASGIGDVLVGWESEGMDRRAAGDAVDIVYPVATLQMEPPVAVVTPSGQSTSEAAREFVDFLSSPEAQAIYAQNHFRPRDIARVKEFQSDFPNQFTLLKIDKLGGVFTNLGGWPDVHKKLFGSEGLWTRAGE